MPAKYTQRHFVNGGHYHIYNRGVEKRQIFLDEQDYRIFRYYLFVYLALPAKVLEAYPQLPFRLQRSSLYRQVLLEAYCLMPNHFHLLLQQQADGAISRLIKQLTNAYTLYFNQKYNRVGPLMQGVFKSVEIDSDNALIHVSRYIHRNPVAANLAGLPEQYPWSSYGHYLGIAPSSFIEYGNILSGFSSTTKYADFVNSNRAVVAIPFVLIDDE